MSLVSDRKRTSVLTEFAARGLALAEGDATLADCAWLERAIAYPNVRDMWLADRQFRVRKNDDLDEITAVLGRDVQHKPSWNRVVELGFSGALAGAGDNCREVMRDIAAILHDPTLLEALELAVFGNVELTPAWATIEADAIAKWGGV